MRFARRGKEEGRDSYFILRTTLLRIDGLLAHWIGRSHDRMFFSHTDFDAHLFFGMWWVLAVIIFACLRALGQPRFVATFLCYAAGIVALAGPLCSYSFAPSGWWLGAARPLQWLEVAVIVGCVLLYLHRAWPANAKSGILVLLLHFAFWRLVIFGPAWRDYAWQALGFLLLPFCTSLVWGYYVRLPAGSHPPS